MSSAKLECFRLHGSGCVWTVYPATIFPNPLPSPSNTATTPPFPPALAPILLPSRKSPTKTSQRPFARPPIKLTLYATLITKSSLTPQKHFSRNKLMLEEHRIYARHGIRARRRNGRAAHLDVERGRSGVEGFAGGVEWEGRRYGRRCNWVRGGGGLSYHTIWHVACGKCRVQRIEGLAKGCGARTLMA